MQCEDITPHTKVLDIVAAHKSTEAIFRSYDQTAGECVLCNALFETLEGLATKYGIDLSELLPRLLREISDHPNQD